MAAITAAMVGQLRERTGLGMMECKKALTETDGDLEAAIELLRKKGTKDRGERVAGEGLVMAYVSDDARTGVLVELNSETDFVARNEDFKALARALAAKAADTHAETVDALLAEAHEDAELEDKTVRGQINAAINRIGEKIQLGRFVRFHASEKGQVTAYVHSTTGSGLDGGRVGVLVETSGDASGALGKDIAMHISFAKPRFLSEADVDADALAKERTIITAQTSEDPRLQGKPEAAINAAVEGRVKKFLGEIVLLNQPYVREDKKTVSQIVADSKGAGIVRFARFEVGEAVVRPAADGEAA
ncbi:MAG: elongation factor Ts [Cytophagales bacterium]|nr:elongation factor Ts [Armatimonadota bacterium]